MDHRHQPAAIHGFPGFDHGPFALTQAQRDELLGDVALVWPQVQGVMQRRLGRLVAHVLAQHPSELLERGDVVLDGRVRQ